MSNSLLATKFHIPHKPESGVSRPRLTGKILPALRQPNSLVLVSGPAGFGKTTLVGSFAAQYARPVAWLSLDEGDNDPVLFWTYLVRACQKVEASLGTTALELLGLPQAPPMEAVLPVLINEMAEMKDELVLVLDDLHLVQNDEIQRSLAYLIDHLPDKFHLVAVTRIDPPWPLARLRARGQLVEIRAADLRFTREETAEYLRGQLGIELPKNDVEALETRTEGWPAGLQLAALSIQGRNNISEFIKNFSGSHLYIAEYLVEEVFKKQPAELQDFLLKTSTLERFNSGLCQAVTGREDAQLVILSLKRANLFVIPMDDEGEWFRYHHLFGDLLTAHLRQTCPPATIQELHKLASSWFASAGMNTEAIEHALMAGDFTGAIRIIEKTALKVILQGHVRTVEAWLKGIPADMVEKNPRINLAYAWMYLLRGLLDRAWPFLDNLEEYFLTDATGAQDSTLQGEWLAIRAKVLSLQGKHTESIDLARQALERLPDRDNLVRTLLYMEIATAYQELLDFDQAAEFFLRASRDARMRGDHISELLGISGRARMTLLQGRLHQTLQIATQGLERMQTSGKVTPFSATLLGEIAQVHYYWNQLEQAEEYLLRSIQTSGMTGYIDLEMFYHLFRSRVCLIQGDLSAADREMSKVTELTRLSPSAMLKDSVISQQVRLDLALGRPEDARAALEAAGVDIVELLNSPARKDVRPVPSGLLAGSALRYWLYLERQGLARVDLKQLAALAGSILETQLGMQQFPEAIESLLLRSQIYQQLGEEKLYQSEVARAVKLAQPEGFISPFLEEGTAIAGMLQALAGRTPAGGTEGIFIRKILAAFNLPAAPEPHPSKPTLQLDMLPLVEPLTNREMEVLLLVSAGNSNGEIAEKLVITVSAVKKHTSNIYAKLNVNSRTLAVARARQLNLLPAD